MRYLLVLFIFFYSFKSFSIEIEKLPSIEELVGMNKVNNILSGLIPPLKTRGASGAKIFKNNAPITTIIYSSSAVDNEMLGSGILVSNDGHIITNYHVIANEDNTYFNSALVVGFCTATKFDPQKSKTNIFAEVLSYNKEKDLALIKISKEAVKDKIPVDIATSYDDVEIATTSHAIGNPNFEMCSYTDGKISQIRDKEWSYDETYQNLSAEVIQTNTEIDSGNSGGPLFNDNGKLIGINTFGTPDTEINFAISFNEVRKFLSNLPVIQKRDLDPNCSLRNVPTIEDTGGEWIMERYDRNCDDYLETIVWKKQNSDIAEYIYIDSNNSTYDDIRVQREYGDLVFYYDEDEDGEFDKYCVSYSEDNIFECKEEKITF